MRDRLPTGILNPALPALLLALLLFTPRPTALAQIPGMFDVARLRPVVEDRSVPPDRRLAMGVAYLKEELAHPSKPTDPSRFRKAGVDVPDTGGVQASIVASLAFPGSEASAALRRQRDQAADPLLRDRLTIALAGVGATDTVPDLVRIARHDPVPRIRAAALEALAGLLRPPKPTDVPRRPLLPASQWLPDRSTRLRIVQAALAGLADPYRFRYILMDGVGSAGPGRMRWAGGRPPGLAVSHPVREAATGLLVALGYSVQRRASVLRVVDRQGRTIGDVGIPAR